MLWGISGTSLAIVCPPDPCWANDRRYQRQSGKVMQACRNLTLVGASVGREVTNSLRLASCGFAILRFMPDLSRRINKITHGDCLDIMRQIPSGSIDLIVTSPPYNIR